jgi:hypothetical protein
MTTELLMYGNRHAYTNSIVELIKAVPVGGLITDEQINQACKASRPTWYRYIRTVKNVLLKEHKILIVRERNQGWRHVADAAVPTIADRTIKHVRREAKKAAAALVYGVKNYNSLQPAEQVEYNTKLAIVGTLHHLATPKAERRIRGAVEVANSRLELGTTLEALSEK